MLLISRKLSVDLSHVSAELTLSLKDKQRSSVSCDALFKPRVYFSATRNQQFDLHYQALSKGVIFKSGNFKVTVEDKNDALDGLIGGGQNHLLSSQEVKIKQVDVFYRLSPFHRRLQMSAWATKW